MDLEFRAERIDLLMLHERKTVLTMRQLHPSRERRQVVIGIGAVEYGLQTLDGLAAWLDG